MRMKLLNRDGKWYRRLRLSDEVIETDYVDIVPGRVDNFRLVKGSVGYTVKRNCRYFGVRISYYREIDPLLGHMIAVKQRARRK